jgi:sugar/nucleoside kinase (ribokinase family)
MEIGKIIPSMGSGKPDVLVLGEVLVELTAPVALREAETLRLSCSGDALNAAAAAAAGGASVALVSVVGDDELGDRILEFAGARGIDTRYVRRSSDRPNGVYFAGAGGEFVYARRGSAGSTLGPDDVARVPGARAVVVSGITQALSESCAAAVDAAVAASDGFVVYDPNFRARLTSVRAARAALSRVAPHATLVTPSCPDDTRALLDTADPAVAARRLRSLGAGAVAVTMGSRGVHVDVDDGESLHLPSTAPPRIVDTTGAGDVLAGTTAARLALGDDLLDALRHAAAAATRSLAAPGGTGWLPAAA